MKLWAVQIDGRLLRRANNSRLPCLYSTKRDAAQSAEIYGRGAKPVKVEIVVQGTVPT